MADRTVEFVFIDGSRTTVHDASQALDCLGSEWKKSTSYSLNQVVWYDYKLYRCNTAHTSSTSWDPSNWDTIELGNLNASTSQKGLVQLTGTYNAASVSSLLALNQVGANNLYLEAVRKGNTSGTYGQVTLSNNYDTIQSDPNMAITQSAAASMYNELKDMIISQGEDYIWDVICSRLTNGINAEIITGQAGRITLKLITSGLTTSYMKPAFLSSLGTEDMFDAGDNLVFTDTDGNLTAHTLTLD